LADEAPDAIEAPLLVVGLRDDHQRETKRGVLLPRAREGLHRQLVTLLLHGAARSEDTHASVARELALGEGRVLELDAEVLHDDLLARTAERFDFRAHRVAFDEERRARGEERAVAFVPERIARVLPDVRAVERGQVRDARRVRERKVGPALAREVRVE